MPIDLNDLLRDPAFRAPWRPWESSTRFWSVLVFQDNLPDRSGGSFRFEAELPDGGSAVGTVSLAESDCWIRFEDLPASITPVYLVLGLGPTPSNRCLRYEALKQHFHDRIQLIDVQRREANSYQVLPFDQVQQEMLADAGACWMLEIDRLPAAEEQAT